MRDEVVLALELYLTEGLSTAETRQQLSDELRSWPIEQELTSDPKFRNEQSVKNKLYNLQWLDTDGAQGREKGGEVTEATWEEFHRDGSAVKTTAAEVRQSVGELTANEYKDLADYEADESSVVVRAHRTRERNRSLVTSKREQALTKTGKLACEACGFDSEAEWGVAGIIECHHTKPVSELATGESTRLADLRLLCPNCHRLVHSSRPWRTWDELVELVSS
jgi:5-methylcytosine-specific restriction protein A